MADISLLIILALAVAIIAFLFVRGMKALALVLCVLFAAAVVLMFVTGRSVDSLFDGGLFDALGELFSGIFGGGAKAAEGPAQMIN